MTERRDTLTHIGPGLASAALGVAAQASDLDGPIVETLAWGAVALGVVLTVGGALRLRVVRSPQKDRRAADRRRQDLAQRLVREGNTIVRFKRERDELAPMGARRSTLLSRRQQRQVGSPRAHTDDTLHLYESRYEPRVRTLLRALIDVGIVGANEARSLLNPGSIDEIELIGQRLLEIGRSLGEGHRQAA